MLHPDIQIPFGFLSQVIYFVFTWRSYWKRWLFIDAAAVTDTVTAANALALHTMIKE